MFKAKKCKRMGPALLALLGVLAGCGSDDDATAADPTGDEENEDSAPSGDGEPVDEEDAPELPVEVTNADGSTTEVTDASRIVPLNGDIAEVVFALGLGDNVVATDVSATYPDEAEALPKIGYQRTLSTEGILAQSPTVLIGDTEAGPPEVLDQVADTVPVAILEFPSDLTQAPTKIRAVAEALGVPGRGEVLADEVTQAIEDVQADLPAEADPPRAIVLYLRGSDVQMIAGTGTGAPELLEAAGAVDVAGEMGIAGAVPITPEVLVDAAPDVIVTTTAGLESVGGIEGLMDIPGVGQTPAAEDGRVLDFDDQYLLGGGPRTGDALADLAEALHR